MFVVVCDWCAIPCHQFCRKTAELKIILLFLQYRGHVVSENMRPGLSIVSIITCLFPMPEFNSYLDILDLTALSDYCREHGETRVFAREQEFLTAGTVCRSFGYVEKGYFKYVTTTLDGTEKIVGFSFENDYVGDINHALASQVSPVSIIAGRSSRVKVVSMDDFVAFAEGKGLRFCVGVSVALFITHYGRSIDRARLTPKEYYQKMLREHPDILQRIPLRELASFLGVTPVHLSRLRRELSLS